MFMFSILTHPQCLCPASCFSVHLSLCIPVCERTETFVEGCCLHLWAIFSFLQSGQEFCEISEDLLNFSKMFATNSLNIIGGKFAIGLEPL